jgi:hypothetical protein
MSTATEQMDHKERQILAERTQRFLEYWQPRDKYDQRDFERDFYYLVHEIYREAQKPLIEQMTKAFAATPMMPTIVPKS